MRSIDSNHEIILHDEWIYNESELCVQHQDKNGSVELWTYDKRGNITKYRGYGTTNTFKISYK